MERFRDYRPNQVSLITFDPEVHFGSGSFEVFLVKTIGNLDLSVFWSGRHAKYEALGDLGGEAPYDPRAMLGIVLYGFSRGIFSSRKLENACRNDLGFQYVSGFNEPDHAALCRFIKDHDGAMKAVFRQLVYIAHASGFIDYHTLALDGTKIRANASKQFTGTRTDFEKRLGALDKYIGLAMARMSDPKESDEPISAKKLEQLRTSRQKINDFLRDVPVELNAQGREKKQNMTDPDSRVMIFNDGMPREAYNAQACVDSKVGLIVGEELVQAENDIKLLNSTLEAVVGLPDAKAQDISVLADSGYWDPQQLSLVEATGAKTYVPDPNRPNPYLPQGGSTGPRIVDIKPDQELPIAICSGGKNIPGTPTLRTHRTREQGTDFRQFPTKKDGECLQCEHMPMCFPNERKRKAFTMSDAKVQHFGTLKAAIQRLDTREGRKIYSRRMPLIERTFAETKAVIGFRKFLRRGIAKVSDEWTMMCTAYNLRKMHMATQKG